MKFRKSHLGLLLFALVAFPARGLDPKRAVTQYMHDVWQTEQGLPQNAVFAICQTRDGYLWLGTQEGLGRFDGVRFTLFDTRNTPELRHNFVSALLEDRDGNLWIGTVGGGVSRLKDGLFRAYTTKDGLSNDHVRALCQGARGDLWIGTDEGLNRLRDGRFTRFTRRNGLSSDSIKSLAPDDRGNLWIGTDGGGLNLFEEGRFRKFTTEDGLPGNRVLALHQEKSGLLWIGTQGGLSRLSGGVFTTFSSKEGLGNDIVVALHEDRQGSLWAGTYGGGLSRFCDGKLTTFGTQEGLSNGIVASIYEDREGSLWIGTSGGGLNRLTDAKFSTTTTREGLSNDVILSTYEDPQGALWIGTNGGGLNRLKDGKVTIFTTRNGLSNDLVFSTLQDRAGVLWIGTDGGLDRMEAGKITPWKTSDPALEKARVRSIFEDSKGTLWVGTDGAGLFGQRDGRVVRITAKEGLSNEIVGWISEGKDGSLWIGTEAGLNRWKDGKLTLFTTKNGLSSDFILSIYEDAEGSLWVGTFGGLNVLRQGQFTSFSASQGLTDSAVAEILEDAEGNIWFTTNKGVLRTRKADLDSLAAGRKKRVASAWYGTSDGMRSAECNGGFQPAGWKTRQGQLWFPTIRGVVMIDPAHMPVNRLPPPVVIEDVLVDRELLGRGKEGSRIVVPPGKEKFEFHYTALSFPAPQKVKFKYRLDGFDRDWVDAGTERTAHYTNLPPRRYTFHVIACNDHGIWNETGASFGFDLEPRFYQSLWFYLFGAIGLLLAATLLYQFRVRRLKARGRELSALVEDRTHDLRHANEELNMRNAQLAALDGEKNELMGIVAHDLKNPLNIIGGYAEMLIEEPDMELPERKETLQKVVQASRRMVELIGYLIDVNALERGQLTCQLSACDVGRVAEQVVDSYRRPAELKAQTLHFALLEGDGVALADPGITLQLCDNLVSNAVKYSPRGTRIWVSVSSSGDAVRLEVKDEGPGLTLEDRKRLFEKFARLSARPTGGEHSTGLGLSIVQKLVKAMNGRVWCESTPGEGATFVVELQSFAVFARGMGDYRPEMTVPEP